MKNLLFLVFLFSVSVGCSTKRYHDTPAYTCERTCIDANKNYEEVKEEWGCLCKNKARPK